MGCPLESKVYNCGTNDPFKSRVWPLLCVEQSTSWFKSKHSNKDKNIYSHFMSRISLNYLHRAKSVVLNCTVKSEMQILATRCWFRFRREVRLFARYSRSVCTACEMRWWHMMTFIKVLIELRPIAGLV